MILSLLLLADARFPAGGHAYSAGVEAAVAAGDVTDTATLDRYLRGRLATTGLTDAAFAAAAAGASRASDAATAQPWADLDAEYSARTASPRLRSTSRRMGRQLCRAAGAIWPDPAISAVERTPNGPHQAVALGAVVTAAGGQPLDAAAICIHHLANAVVTSAVRLLGLDPVTCVALQSRAVDWWAPQLDAAPAWAMAQASDLPAAAGSLTEILGEHHATWSHRLFIA